MLTVSMMAIRLEKHLDKLMVSTKEKNWAQMMETTMEINLDIKMVYAWVEDFLDRMLVWYLHDDHRHHL